MNKKTSVLIVLIAALIVAVVGYQLYSSKQSAHSLESAAKETVTNKDLGFSFMYPKGEGAFTLAEPNGTEKGMLKAYLLLPTTEYEQYQKGDTGEAPASMNVFVFALPEAATTTASSTETPNRITRLQNWATDNTTLTSFKQAKNTPDIVELDGIQALHYQADGLYQQDIYLVAYKKRIYMFVAQYNDESDITYTAFQDFIKTATFD